MNRVTSSWKGNTNSRIQNYIKCLTGSYLKLEKTFIGKNIVAFIWNNRGTTLRKFTCHKFTHV